MLSQEKIYFMITPQQIENLEKLKYKYKGVILDYGLRPEDIIGRYLTDIRNNCGHNYIFVYRKPEPTIFYVPVGLYFEYRTKEAFEYIDEYQCKYCLKIYHKIVRYYPLEPFRGTGGELSIIMFKDLFARYYSEMDLDCDYGSSYGNTNEIPKSLMRYNKEHRL